MMKQIFAVIFFILIFYFAGGNEKSYFFEKISPESGFAFDAIQTITEDNNGFIWFGCNNGLYHYNTSVIEKISLIPPQANSPQSFAISKIYNDLSGQLWVCSEYGVYRYISSMNHFEYVHFLFPDSTSTRFTPAENILQFDFNTYVVVFQGELYSFKKNDTVLKKINREFDTNINNISYIGKDEKGNLLVGTSDGKVFYGKNIHAGLALLFDSKNNTVRSVCLDENKYYIGYEGQGVDVVNLDGTKIYELNENLPGKQRIVNNRVRQIIKRANGEIWIGTYQGITIITPDKNIEITNKLEYGLPNNSIYEFYQGKNNGIWIGTWAGGIAYYHDFNYHFKHVKKVPYEKNEPKSIISSFAQSLNGKIFVGSEQAGISIFDSQKTEFSKRDVLFDKKEIQRIKSLVSNDSDKLLIGTFDAGVWIYDQKTGNLKNIENSLLKKSSIYITSVWLNNSFWIATRGNGLFKYNPENEKTEEINFEVSDASKPGAQRIWKLLFDSAHNLWICTDEGIFVKGAGTAGIEKRLRTDSIFNLGKSMIYSICEDKKGRLWLGTRGKGLFVYYPENDSVGKNLTKNMDVYSILKDNNHDMWFTTNHGIFRYKLDNEETVRFTSFDRLSGEQYTPNSAYLCENGELLFGSSNGFNIINPSDIQKNTIEPKIFPSKILVNNIPLASAQDVSTNSLQVAEIEELKLKYNQNSITIGVVTDNFIKPDKNIFRYRLQNYTEEWVETGYNQDISFTKIPPGKYTFEVFGANNDGLWSTSPYQLEITILHPLLLRWYAKIAYLFVLLGVAFLVFKELRFRIRLRKEIMAERFKNEAQQMLYAEKLKFFTNISHEIRTPLTLIISPLKNLIKKFQYDESTTKHLHIIQRNSKRLLRLTNQILDLRLIESGKLNPNFQKTELIHLTAETYKCFELQFVEKQINFIFTSTLKSLWINIDSDMTEKILYNLISNALKFSHEKGQIIFSVENKHLKPEDYKGYVSSGDQFAGEAVEIKVRDFGKGIKPEILPRIFERFTKDPDEKDTGTGIGLNLCQEYARLNNGNILVSSEPGRGATFIFNIPIDNVELEKENIILQFPLEKTEYKTSENETITNARGNKKIILLAEDNDELRAYLKDYLSHYFKIITAKNGKQAVEITKEIKPDIVITDILMPEKDGIEVIQVLKDNYQTSHIPVIVLTALYEGDYQMKSILKGADAYLVKPVDESLLLAQIENILISREMIEKRLKVSNETHHETLGLNGDSVIANAEKLIENNLQNVDFDTIMLAKALHISRSTLHRKIKSATNQSPTEFIRDIRLKNAVMLLKKGKYNIDEIGAFVGFNSTSYFIRSFKQKYGKTPKEYYTSSTKI
jgi:signal transduction histidine kinase/ligand-binding sensor domain-containing protein/DNA-binding response OmpR family regulator